MTPSELNQSFSFIWTEVRDELGYALAKFPPFHSAHEGWAVIREELDELWTEVRANQSVSGRNQRMRREAIQVAAMAIRFVLELNQFKN